MYLRWFEGSPTDHLVFRIVSVALAGLIIAVEACGPGLSLAVRAGLGVGISLENGHCECGLIYGGRIGISQPLGRPGRCTRPSIVQRTVLEGGFVRSLVEEKRKRHYRRHLTRTIG
jgi:hypothetical protein